MAAGLVILGVRADAGDLGFTVTGNLVGVVLNPEDAPAMGASVLLFNKFERLLARTTVDLNGAFAFPNLPADVYSVRVSAASYLPVSRDQIAVHPGTDSLLQVHLATLLSTVHVSYRAPVSGMSNDWKWVLRSSPATRPVIRYLPENDASPEGRQTTAKGRAHGRDSRVFSDTRAMFSISGGDPSIMDSGLSTPDLGTGFVLSTNVVGKHQLQLGGTYAQDPIGASPAVMSLTAIYKRDRESGSGYGPSAPEVAFAVSQFSILPGQNAVAAATQAPPVRSMSMSIYQTLDLVEAVHVEYGVVGESIDYLQHTSRVSPFARITLSAGGLGELVGSYSDGARPQELLRHQPRGGAIADMERGDDLLSTTTPPANPPQFSYSNGRLELQRTHSFEMGYRVKRGSRTYAASVFRESVTNGRIHVAGDLSALQPGDLLSDGVSETSVYNIGAYRRNGALLSVDQQLGDSIDVSLAYGRMGGLTPNPVENWGSDLTGSELLKERSHNIGSANLGARLPKAGTRLAASYGWADSGAVLPSHVFTTQNSYVSPGFNVFLKQPLPNLFGMPGRLEFTADVRNLLTQGYVPVITPSGQTIQFVQAPRTLRGGVNFIF
jgi:hypothetical protein